MSKRKTKVPGHSHSTDHMFVQGEFLTVSRCECGWQEEVEDKMESSRLFVSHIKEVASTTVPA